VQSDQALNHAHVDRGLIADQQRGCLNSWRAVGQSLNSTANRTADSALPLVILYCHNAGVVELATKLLVLAPDNDNNRRTASFAGGVDDSANKAFASKWNQLLRLTEARRPSLRMS